ncbi:hypothetical protein ABKA04_009606 [Annulohypoxylon sp. FPYF3050]
MSSVLLEGQPLIVSVDMKSENGKLQIHCCFCSSKFTKLGNFQNHLGQKHRFYAGPNQYGFVPLPQLQGPDLNSGSGHNPAPQPQYSGRIINPNQNPTLETYGYNNYTDQPNDAVDATSGAPYQNIAISPTRRLSVISHARRPPGAANQDTNSILAPDDGVTSKLPSDAIENHGDYMPFYQNQYQGYSNT